MPRKTTLVAALACLYFGPGLLFLYLAGGVCHAEAAPADAAGAAAVMIPDGEPGEPMVIIGTVYGPDGETPAEGVTVYAYHTDAAGLYSETNDNSDPRIKATVVTRADGRYRFETIRPAAYPEGGVAAHVHYRVSGGGYPAQRFTLHFEGDPNLSARARERAADRGRFGSIRPLERTEDGGWRVVFDLRLAR